MTIALGVPAAHEWLRGTERLLILLLVSPHFLVSYQLLYWDRRAQLLSDPKLIFAAFVVPLALLLLVLQAYLRPVVPLWLMIQAMFLLSGWHYLKQSFGCAVAACAAAGAPLEEGSKSSLRLALLALGALAFLVPNTGSMGFLYGGLGYPSLKLPHALVWIAAAVLFGALLKVPRKLPPAALAALGGFAIWTLPILVYPDAFYTFRFVPLTAALHSLQYLAFAAPIRRKRSGGGWGFAAGWLIMTAVVGPLLFYALPNRLDAALAYDKAALGPFFVTGMVHWFVNVHHYFIDAAIWRRDNADLRAFIAERAAA